jgi:hypothetical protein
MELEGFGDPPGFFDIVHAPFTRVNVEGTDLLDTEYYRSVPYGSIYPLARCPG